MIDLPVEVFSDLVREAVESVPAGLADNISNVAIVVADVDAEDPGLLGLYEGVPLTERGDTYSGALPDRITIFRLPTLARCATVMEVVEEVRVTVLHEIAHHFGIDDDDLQDWGWG